MVVVSCFPFVMVTMICYCNIDQKISKVTPMSSSCGELMKDRPYVTIGIWEGTLSFECVYFSCCFNCRPAVDRSLQQRSSFKRENGSIYTSIICITKKSKYHKKEQYFKYSEVKMQRQSTWNCWQGTVRNCRRDKSRKNKSGRVAGDDRKDTERQQSWEWVAGDRQIDNLFAMEECWDFLTAEAYLATQRPACSQANVWSTAVSLWSPTQRHHATTVNELPDFTQMELSDELCASDEARKGQTKN